MCAERLEVRNYSGSQGKADIDGEALLLEVVRLGRMKYLIEPYVTGAVYRITVENPAERTARAVPVSRSSVIEAVRTAHDNYFLENALLADESEGCDLERMGLDVAEEID
jgi:hypothetical protein